VNKAEMLLYTALAGWLRANKAEKLLYAALAGWLRLNKAENAVRLKSRHNERVRLIIK
jgi:hypothetical protein